MNQEEIKEFLKTDEGQSILTEINAPLLANKDAIVTEKREIEAEVKQLKQAEETRLADIAKTKADVEEKRINDAGDFDAYKLHMETKLSESQTEIENFQSKYANKEVERLISAEASRYSSTPHPLRLLLKERIKTQIVDGVVDYIIKDTDGKTMYYDGEPARISHLVEQLKANEDYGSFFNATGSSGAGTSKSSGATTSSYKDMNSNEFNLSKAMGNKL